jgi:hypothetical protein
MQSLIHARGFDLAEQHRCLLVTLADAAPEQLPADAKPLPKEWGKRKTINVLPGSCVKLRWGRGKWWSVHEPEHTLVVPLPAPVHLAVGQPRWLVAAPALMP